MWTAALIPWDQDSRGRPPDHLVSITCIEIPQVGGEGNADFVLATMYNFPLIATHEIGTIIIHTYRGKTEA